MISWRGPGTAIIGGRMSVRIKLNWMPLCLVLEIAWCLACDDSNYKPQATAKANRSQAREGVAQLSMRRCRSGSCFCRHVPWSWFMVHFTSGFLFLFRRKPQKPQKPDTSKTAVGVSFAYPACGTTARYRPEKRTKNKQGKDCSFFASTFASG